MVSPLSVLPERACRGCVNGLGRIVLRGIGMRNDLVDGDGNFGAADGDGGDNDRRRRRSPLPVAVARNEDDDDGRRSGGAMTLSTATATLAQRTGMGETMNAAADDRRRPSRSRAMKTTMTGGGAAGQ